MLWTFTTAAGSYLYIVLMIIPHVIVSLFSRTGNLPHILARSWARFTLLCSGARVELRGRENIPDGPAVYMANHVSHFDVFAILGHLDIQFRWTVKKELYTIPLLGLAMRRAGYIMIDRSNHEKAVRSLKTAAEKIRNGTSIVIFPRAPDHATAGSNTLSRKEASILPWSPACLSCPLRWSALTRCSPSTARE